MNAIDRVPGLQEILDECKNKIENLTGEKVSIHYTIKFHHLATSDLARFICEICEVSWEKVASDSRKAQYIIARHLYCYFARTVQKKTLKHIAEVLGGRDHTTIIHAVDKVKTMIEINDELYIHPYNEIQKLITQTLI